MESNKRVILQLAMTSSTNEIAEVTIKKLRCFVTSAVLLVIMALIVMVMTMVMSLMVPSELTH